jgi:hypothetical protein
LNKKIKELENSKYIIKIIRRGENEKILELNEIIKEKDELY